MYIYIFIYIYIYLYIYIDIHIHTNKQPHDVLRSRTHAQLLTMDCWPHLHGRTLTMKPWVCGSAPAVPYHAPKAGAEPALRRLLEVPDRQIEILYIARKRDARRQADHGSAPCASGAGTSAAL